MNYPKEFENLIDSFRRLPGVGYKSAERMAYQYLEMQEEYKEKFIESMKDISKLKKCEICHNLSSLDFPAEELPHPNLCLIKLPLCLQKILWDGHLPEAYSFLYHPSCFCSAEKEDNRLYTD